MRTAYLIDGQKIFTGASIELDPKDGRHPRSVVTDTPPPEGIAQWTDEGWVSLSERPPKPPKPALTVADLKKERDRRVDAGSSFSIPGVADPIPVPGKQPYREVIQAKFSAAQGFKAQGVTDASVLFRDGANVMHYLTPDQMLALCLQSMQWYEAVMVAYWAMKDGTGDFTEGIPDDFADDKWWP